MNNAAEQWWYAQQSQRLGPVSASALKALADSGELHAEDLVWHQGLANWVTAASIDGLIPAIPPLPPPLPVAEPAPPAAPVDVTPPEADASLEPYIRAFVGEKYAFYARHWGDMQRKNSLQSWNWAAFLLGVLWMAYRKMYAYSALVIGGVVLEGMVEEALGLPEALTTAINIAIAVTLGLHGNYLYKLHVEKKTREIVALHSKREWAMAEVTRQGGTNAWAALGFLLLFVLILAVLLAATQAK